MSRSPPSSAVAAFELRAREFLQTHRRIVADFERSLKSARHYVKLAGRSLELEPESTVDMLGQIREIDLLRHVTQQFEEFESVLAMLPPDLVQGDPTLPDGGAPAEFKSLRARYEAMVRDAESQAEEMEKILSALTAPH
jgi:hypothetical protein